MIIGKFETRHHKVKLIRRDHNDMVGDKGTYFCHLTGKLSQNKGKLMVEEFELYYIVEMMKKSKWESKGDSK